jgi:hypothetical protein
VTGATVTGTTANFQSGVFTTQISGATVTGDVGSFSTITGGTVTLTSGVFGTGTAAAPSIAFTGDSNTGIYSPGADQVAVATNGTGRLFVDASGNVKITSSQYQAIAHKNISADAIYGAVVIGSGSGSQGNISLGFDVSTTTGLNFSGTAQTYFHPNGALIPNNAGTNYIGLFSRDSSDSILLGPATSSGKANGPLTLTSTSVGIGTSAPGSNLDLAGTTSRIRWDLNNAYTLATHGNAAFSAFASSVQSAADYQFQIAGITKMSLDASGRVGIGTTSPGSALEVKAAAPVLTVNSAVANASSIVLQENGTTYARFRFDGNNVDIGNLYVNGATIFNAGNAERARIDSSGRLLVGTSTARDNFFNTSGLGGLLQVEGANNNARRVISHVYGVTGPGGPILALGKHRSNSVGDNTVVQSGDECGILSFLGSDGTEFVEAAQIRAEADGTPGANDMPGRLVFSTTADGASSPTERLRITSAGLVGIGTSAPGALLSLQGTFGTSLATGLRIDGLGSTTDNVSPIAFYNQSSGWGTQHAANIACGILSGTNGGGYLRFSTSPDGNTAPAERLRITATGLVGIGTTSPGAPLHVRSGSSGGTAYVLSTAVVEGSTYGYLDIKGTSVCGINFGDAANAQVGVVEYDHGSDFMRFIVASGERARIDANGRLLVGTSTYRTVGTYGYEAKTQIEGTSSVVAGLTLTGNRNDGLGPYFVLGRSRGTTAGSSTAVQNGDELGTIQFCGADGTDLETAGALIRAEVDGTPGANDMPGRLVFSTTADGAASPTERMRIDSTGLMTLAGPGIKFPATQVASADPNTLDDYEEGTWTPTQEANLTVVGTFSSTGRYLKIGRQVFAEGVVTGSTSVEVLTTNGIAIGGLPFTPGYSRTPGLAGNETISASATFQLVGTTLYFMQTMAATTNIRFVVTYSV